MRLIKLSTKEFKTHSEVERYFAEDLPKRTPPGLFRITNGRISADGLCPGETIIFSYRNNICFITTAKTGRISNEFLPATEYPYCILIDLPSHKIKVPLEDLQQALHEKTDFKKSFKGSGWTKIPDSKLTEQVVNKLIRV